MRGPARTAAILAVLIASGKVSTAADLTGTVTLPDGRPAGGAVVYLKGSGASPAPLKAVVDQRDKTFIPHVSVVPVGSTINFPNNDTVFHNVFAYFQAKKFDLGMYPRGKTKTVKFDKPGLVAVLCNVHSDMSAYIMVVDTNWYAVADRDGRFKVAGVADGEYTLHAWHESGVTAEPRVSCRGGEPVKVGLRRR